MHIVLTGALPDAGAARALLPEMARAAPALTRWLARARGRVQVHAVRSGQTGCTEEEWWRLRLNGYQARQNGAAGLAVLRWYGQGGADETKVDEKTHIHQTAPHQPIWLAELVHIAPTQHGAGLLAASDLHISAAQDRALFDSLQALGESRDFTLHRFRPGLWRVEPAPYLSSQSSDLIGPCASPALLARSSVNAWWPQQQEARSWRRLFNEVQMLWFDHPVNRQRQQQGAPVINGLWLFGGASPGQFSALGAHEHIRWHDDLLPSFLKQDWAQWLQTLARLDAQVFQHLADPGSGQNLTRLDLTGASRVVEITSARQLRRPLGWFDWLGRDGLGKLTGTSQAWTKWWCQD